LLCFVLVLSSWGTAHAAILTTSDFASWLRALQQEAVENGVSPETAQEALSSVMLDERVIANSEKQPETTITFADYVHRAVSPERITEGRRLLQLHARLLNDVASRFGVSPQVIVALWGLESSFGHNSGEFNIVDSLATLAYEGHRVSFFRKELLNALQILDRTHVPATALRGSWAGAMGQCQFMPSTYLHYAVSYENGGAPDIWENTADVFASIANYIAVEGWKSELTWGREVILRHTIPEEKTGLEYKTSLAEWNRSGVHSVDGGTLPNKPLEASLIAPDGPSGRHFLVYDNYRALMRWNRSTFFATAVGLLADRIAR
jgi:membrane-bound lytic murein transglycosylase B